jgi:hypothetical protein
LKNESNPYAAPETEATPVSEVKTKLELEFIRRRYGIEAAGLAGFWFFFGIILIGLGSLGYQSLPSVVPRSWSSIVDDSISISFFCMGFVGVLWVIIGILTAFRIERAIEIGLYTTYGMFIFPAIWLTVIGLLMLPLVIAQAHRVLKSGEDLRNAKLAYERARLADP